MRLSAFRDLYGDVRTQNVLSASGEWLAHIAAVTQQDLHLAQSLSTALQCMQRFWRSVTSAVVTAIACLSSISVHRNVDSSKRTPCAAVAQFQRTSICLSRFGTAFFSPNKDSKQTLRISHPCFLNEYIKP